VQTEQNLPDLLKLLGSGCKGCRGDWKNGEGLPHYPRHKEQRVMGPKDFFTAFVKTKILILHTKKAESGPLLLFKLLTKTARSTY
jgi:hypothetical protein